MSWNNNNWNSNNNGGSMPIPPTKPSMGAFSFAPPLAGKPNDVKPSVVVGIPKNTVYQKRRKRKKMMWGILAFFGIVFLLGGAAVGILIATSEQEEQNSVSGGDNDSNPDVTPTLSPVTPTLSPVTPTLSPVAPTLSPVAPVASPVSVPASELELFPVETRDDNAHIGLLFVQTPSQDILDAILATTKRWNDIVGEQDTGASNSRTTAGNEVCGLWDGRTLSFTIFHDHLRLVVDVESDVPFATGGSCFFTSSGTQVFLPHAGALNFAPDSQVIDIEYFENVVLHEIGHALGISSNLGNTGEEFTGTFAVAEKAAAGGSGNLLMDTGHWEDSAAGLPFVTMNPEINLSQDVPALTRVTIAALIDLGYQNLDETIGNSQLVDQDYTVSFLFSKQSFRGSRSDTVIDLKADSIFIAQELLELN